MQLVQCLINIFAIPHFISNCFCQSMYVVFYYETTNWYFYEIAYNKIYETNSCTNIVKLVI